MGLERDAALLERAAPPLAGERIPFDDLTPHLSAGRERLLHAVAIVTLGYAAYYLVWRWSNTLNPDALWISVPLALAETVAVLTLGLFTFNAWSLRRRTPPRAPEGLSVDVWITTYDEPLDVIRKTALGAKSITYPHRTWLLDDGRRLEVARLARELGVGYITREDNRHAKAGNLNNALGITEGDFILQLDADHVPLPHILDRLLGYMRDPAVAFVQSPQSFYNTDAFNTHRNPETGRFITDQNSFFTVIQPGKDRLNAAFFCGSCAVIRRSAIESIGGFSTDTITEDIETSLELHSRGWQSVYHDEALAWGLAPRTATGFKLQRSRWARGGMQLLRRHNPLTMRGLTASQRISYFGSVMHPIDGPVRLIFILAPLIYLLTGVYPVRSFGLEFLAHFLPFVALSLLLHQLLARGRAGPFWYQEFSATAKAFTLAAALPAFLTNRRLKFRVTPKGLDRVAWRTHLPYAVALGITVAAMAWGTLAFGTALRQDAADRLAYGVNIFWAGWNGIVMALVLVASVRSHQRRPMQRFDELLPFHLRIVGADGSADRWITAVTENLHEAGLAFRALEPVPVGTHVRVSLPLATGEVTVNGLVVHMTNAVGGHIGMHRHGVAFEDLPQPVRDAINLHCLHHAVPGSRTRYIDHVDPIAGLVRVVYDRRSRDRHRVQLPVHARVSGSKEGSPRELLAVLEDRSRGGVRLVVDAPVELGSRVRYHIPGTMMRGTGEVVNRQSIPTPLGERHILGLRRVAGSAEDGITIERPRLGMIRKVAMVAGLITAVRRFGFALAFGAGALAAAAGPAMAQLASGYLAGGEAADDGQNMQLLGLWLSGGNPEWRAVGGVIAYRLAWDDGVGGSTNVLTANPFIGVRRQWGATGAQANVGWSFENESVAAGQRRVSSGLTTAFQLGRGGVVATSASALVSYSWGDDGYLWSRGRVAQRVVGDDERLLRLGVEATAQGGGGYRAWEVGPLLEWQPGAFAFVTSGGYRHSRSGGSDSAGTAFVRLELVVAR